MILLELPEEALREGERNGGVRRAREEQRNGDALFLAGIAHSLGQIFDRRVAQEIDGINHHARLRLHLISQLDDSSESMPRRLMNWSSFTDSGGNPAVFATSNRR